MIFLDTSGIYALADTDDANHNAAVTAFQAAQNTGHRIVTSNYVLVESAALLQRRLGHKSALALLHDASKFDLIWITPEIHAQGVRRLQKTGSPKVSFVDAVSFVVMRMRGIDTYLGFDRHFEEEGFRRFSR
jgi:predicted nucleic acid-binding protein